MRHLRILVLTAMLATTGGIPVLRMAAPAVAAQNRTPAAQDEFVPIDQLPPEEQVPAAPMVVAAYSFVWIAFLAYVLSLVKRMRKVEADLSTLERNRR